MSSRVTGKSTEESGETSDDTIASHQGEQSGVAPSSITGMNINAMIACQSTEAAGVVQMDCGLVDQTTKSPVRYSSGFKATFIDHVNVNVATKQIASTPTSTGENSVRYLLANADLTSALGQILKGKVTLTASANVITPDGKSTPLSGSSAVSLQYGLMFVTQAKYSGNFGGWQGAYQTCITEAKNLNLSLNSQVRHIPLLADSTHDPCSETLNVEFHSTYKGALPSESDRVLAPNLMSLCSSSGFSGWYPYAFANGATASLIDIPGPMFWSGYQNSAGINLSSGPVVSPHTCGDWTSDLNASFGAQSILYLHSNTPQTAKMTVGFYQTQPTDPEPFGTGYAGTANGIVGAMHCGAPMHLACLVVPAN